MATGNPAIDGALARLKATMDKPGATRTPEEIAAFEARIKESSDRRKRPMREYQAAKAARGRREPYAG